MEDELLNMNLLCLEDMDVAMDIPDLFANTNMDADNLTAHAHYMNGEVRDGARPIFPISPIIVDDSHWDQVMRFQHLVDCHHGVAVPNYTCVHAPGRMFSMVGYRPCLEAGLVDDFENWRSYFNQCAFYPFVLVNEDTPEHMRMESSVIQDGFGVPYYCPHENRSATSNKNTRTRPVCCDHGCRSLCWMDLNITYHRSIYGMNIGMPVCVNAPVKGFQVYSLKQHPTYRIREMFHCGSSGIGGVAMLNDIDAGACKEIRYAVYVMKRLRALPYVWCYMFDYLNEHEKMIFSSMALDANDVDIEHHNRSIDMYGYNIPLCQYILSDDTRESDVNTTPLLKKLMNKRNFAPHQQLSKYAAAYDIMNTVNRHAVRVHAMCDWADILFRLMHNVGEMVSNEYQFLVDDSIAFRAGGHVCMEDHRKRHSTYIIGLQSVYEVLTVITNNPRPTAVLRLFDRLIRAYHGRIYQGHTLAHVLYEIMVDECPMRHDLHKFFTAIEWDFSKFNGVSPPSSVGVFLLQMLKISSVEMSYFEFLMSEFSSSIVFDSNVCGCDKCVLDEAFVISHEIRDMIQALRAVSC